MHWGVALQAKNGLDSLAVCVYFGLLKKATIFFLVLNPKGDIFALLKSSVSSPAYIFFSGNSLLNELISHCTQSEYAVFKTD